MPSPERRSNPRRPLRVPIRLRCSEIAEEISTHTENVSWSGAFLTSPKRLPVGSPLSLTLRVPIEISGSAYSELRCEGRVVHEYESKNERIGYGIEISKIVACGQTPPTVALNEIRESQDEAGPSFPSPDSQPAMGS